MEHEKISTQIDSKGEHLNGTRAKILHLLNLASKITTGVVKKGGEMIKMTKGMLDRRLRMASRLNNQLRQEGIEIFDENEFEN